MKLYAMQNKKKMIIGFAVLMLVVFAVGFCLGEFASRKAKPNQSAATTVQTPSSSQTTAENAALTVEAGTVALVGRISGLKMNNGRVTADLNLVELFTGQEDAGRAAIVDGTCTLDQVESSQCLNSPLHMRDTSKELSLVIESAATATVYAREAGGGMLINSDGTTYTENISAKAFADLYAQQAKVGNGFSQTIYLVHVKGDEIVKLEEKLTP